MSGLVGQVGTRSGVIRPQGGYSFYAINTNVTQSSDGYWGANQLVTNNGNCFNLSTDKFTAPINGTYAFSFHTLYRGGGSPNSMRIWWTINGTKYAESSNSNYSSAYMASSGEYMVTINGILNLYALDEVQVYVDLAGGDIYGNANGHNGFSGHHIL